MSHTTRVLIFIVSIFVLLFLNFALLAHESKSGLRFSRWLTFMLPITILYFVLFKLSGNVTSANPTSENAIRPAENQLEESESDILAKEFNDSEVEWHEINEWPLDSAVIVGEIDSTVKEEPPGTHKQIEQLERLAKLRLEGHLTEDEYNTLKVKLLNV